jgi:hypothetical protein
VDPHVNGKHTRCWVRFRVEGWWRSTVTYLKPWQSAAQRRHAPPRIEPYNDTAPCGCWPTFTSKLYVSSPLPPSDRRSHMSVRVVCFPRAAASGAAPLRGARLVAGPALAFYTGLSRNPTAAAFPLVLPRRRRPRSSLGDGELWPQRGILGSRVALDVRRLMRLPTAAAFRVAPRRRAQSRPPARADLAQPGEAPLLLGRGLPNSTAA